MDTAFTLLKTALLALLVCAFFALAISGCGKKGPLYLPDEDRPAAAARAK